MMRKKTMLLFLCLLLVFMFGGNAMAESFSDVSATSPYAAYIAHVQQKGITDGIGGGKFGPELPVTRAAFAKFVVDAFHLDLQSYDVPFRDVKGHWAALYIETAYHAGIVSGTSRAAYSPNQALTREAAAAMIWRYMKAHGETAIAGTTSLREKPSPWAEEAVKNVIAYRLFGADVVKSPEGWSYRPKQTMKRKEMAVMLDLSTDLMDKAKAGGTAADNAATEPVKSTPFPVDSWQGQLQARLENQQTDFTIKMNGGGQFSDIKPQLDRILDSDDYLHYVFSAYRYQMSGNTVTFHVDYLETKQQTDWVKQKTKAILPTILTEGMTDLQKEKAVHDYIVSHVAYDTTLKKASAYEALTSGETVCQGYALLTYEMLKRAGIDNRIAEGEAGGELHTWNVVKLDGNWYHLDTTWDDPVQDRKDKIDYSYFNLTDDQLKRDHHWTLDYPRADTDFVSWMAAKLAAGGSDADIYGSLLGDMKLQAELPANTADSIAALQALLQAPLSQKQGTISFRYKTSQANAENVLNQAVDQAFMRQYGIAKLSYSYRQDMTRDPAYVVFDCILSYH